MREAAVLSKLRSSAALLVSLLALCVAVGGASLAAGAATSAVQLITGKDIKDSSLTGKDVKDSSLTTSDIKDASLLAIDFKNGQLPTGPQGPQGPKGDRAQVIGADVIGSITGDAGAVAAHSCTTAALDVAGAQVGDLPLLAFVGATPVPPGLTFQVLKITSPDNGILRFCNPTDVASPAFSTVGVRIVTFR
jgi:hypothetical protein